MKTFKNQHKITSKFSKILNHIQFAYKWKFLTQGKVNGGKNIQ